MFIQHDMLDENVEQFTPYDTSPCKLRIVHILLVIWYHQQVFGFKLLAEMVRDECVANENFTLERTEEHGKSAIKKQYCTPLKTRKEEYL